jgi:hypothetical protein
VPLPNRVGHLRSSARLLGPASHRWSITRVAYASPLVPVALRLWLHGAPRLSYLRVCPCVCTARGVALMCAAREAATPAAPPNTCCSRPPCLGDFSPPRVPTARRGSYRTTRRAAAERHRWAGGFLDLLLQFVCSALVSTSNAQEPPCPSPHRVGHLRSSARLRAPATHRLPVTRAAYASPLVHIALRLWLHGAPRLSYFRVCPWVCTARGIALMCADREAATLSRPAQHLLQPTALSGRFSTPACADCSWRLTSHYSSGGG